MITKQKNYVHAYIEDIPEDKQNSYINIINKHHEALNNLINSTGNESRAKDMQKNLTSIRKTEKDKLTLDQKIMDFLKKEDNAKLYDSFLNAILDDFSDISVDREKLLTKDLKINPDAIHSVRVGFKKVEESTNYHVLKTIIDRYNKAVKALEDEITNKEVKGKIRPWLDELNSIIQEYSKKILGKKIDLDKMAKLKHLEKSVVYDRYKNKRIYSTTERYDDLQKALNELYKLVRSADIINKLEARIREIIVTMMIETGDNISDEAIRGAIEKSFAANQTVGFSFDEKITGKLFGKEAEKYTKSRYTKRVGDDDFYIDFGVEQVKNKIDGYITINGKKKGISVKSYSIQYGTANNVTLADSLNLLSLILGMNNIDKSYAFLNTIAPKRKNKLKRDKFGIADAYMEKYRRKEALNILKRQAIYAAATGHLGGRQLLKDNNKAEYLVIEDKTSPNVFVYAMSTIINNADKYISVNPNPFKLNTYEEYFENNYITGGKDYLAAMRRNTLLLLKLRQTKLDIGVKKSALKGEASLIDNNLVPYDNK